MPSGEVTPRCGLALRTCSDQVFSPMARRSIQGSARAAEVAAGEWAVDACLQLSRFDLSFQNTPWALATPLGRPLATLARRGFRPAQTHSFTLCPRPTAAPKADLDARCHCSAPLGRRVALIAPCRRVPRGRGRAVHRLPTQRRSLWLPSHWAPY